MFLETVIAMLLLGVALIGLALLVPVALQANQRSRVDSEANMLAQGELEQMVAQPVTATSFTDAAGNTVSLAAGGSPLANSAIDFAQAAVTNYQAFLTSTSGAQYELRWNVQSLPDGDKLFTIAARKRSSQRFLLPPVNLKTRVGR